MSLDNRLDTSLLITLRVLIDRSAMGNASSYEASAVEQERWGESGLGRPEMPSKEEVDKRFTTILVRKDSQRRLVDRFSASLQETMNLPADKATAMAEYSYEKKWTLVCDQVNVRRRMNIMIIIIIGTSKTNTPTGRIY